nr:unnamed protein product [Spirometra erinaceieuropaei]
MTQILLENSFAAATEEEIVNAFKALDTEKTGFIPVDVLEEHMTKEACQLSGTCRRDRTSTPSVLCFNCNFAQAAASAYISSSSNPSYNQHNLFSLHMN